MGISPTEKDRKNIPSFHTRTRIAFLSNSLIGLDSRVTKNFPSLEINGNQWRPGIVTNFSALKNVVPFSGDKCAQKVLEVEHTVYSSGGGIRSAIALLTENRSNAQITDIKSKFFLRIILISLSPENISILILCRDDRNIP